MWKPTVISRLAFLGMCVRAANAQNVATLDIRGKPQTLRSYGSPGGPPVIIASGDGGWFHLGPHVAATVAARGYCVVGLDVRAYLESFTSNKAFLQQADVPGDFRAVAKVAERRCGQPRPIVVGISEGAGLAILAASDPLTQSAIAGVVGIGLGDLNELAWRWRDAVIYLTHRVPNEPTFTVSKIIGQVAPLPLALIHSTGRTCAAREDTAAVLGGPNAQGALGRCRLESSLERKPDRLQPGPDSSARMDQIFFLTPF